MASVRATHDMWIKEKSRTRNSGLLPTIDAENVISGGYKLSKHTAS